MIAHSGVCPVRVGREAEIAALGASLAGVATSGRGRLVLLAGEAGVGKSRLAAEASSMAGERGLVRLDGQCTPDAGIPYAPFVQAIRRRTRLLDAAALRELFAGPAAFAAALLPEVAAEVGLPPTPPAAEDLYAAVWQLLARLLRGNAGMLLLEDLHWADADTLRLLGSLARELDDLALWLVGTYRADEVHRRHPLQALLVDLGRERRYDTIALSPLDRDSVRRMVSEIFDGTEVGDEFTDVVLQRTGGNPFFVEELSKVLLDSGDVYWGGDDWVRRDLSDIHLPETVRETLLARARAMDPDVLSMLQVAAIAGDALDLAVVAAASARPDTAVEDVVREGLRQQLLAERRDGGSVRYVFRHALTREALADELVGPDRRRVHRAVADAIRTVHADRIDAFAAELTDHYAAAGDDDEAYELCLRAARVAKASYAGDEADRRFDQALRLRRTDDADRMAVLLEAAHGARLGSVTPLQLAFAREARDIARILGDPVSEALALQPLMEERWLAGQSAQALAYSREAAALVRGHDDHVEALMLRELTRQLQLSDQTDAAEALLPRGIELASRSGNLSALAGLYGTRLLATPIGPEFDKLLAASLDAARSAHDLDEEQNVSVNAGYISLWCGDFAQSRTSLLRGQEVRELIAPSDGYALAGLAWLDSLTGDYENATRLADTALADPTVPTRFVAMTAQYEVAERRGLPEAADIAEQLVALSATIGEAQRSVPALAARARQTLRVQGIEAAMPAFEQAMAATVNLRRQGSHWAFAPDAAAALAAERRVDELRAWVDEVRALTTADSHPHNRAAERLCSAFLLATTGDADAAREAFTSAADAYSSLPCPARAAEAQLGLADLEWDDGSPDASVAAATRAAATADQLRAPTLAAAARRAVDRAAEPPVLATVLFTDIVGSTELAAAMGDRGWNTLLERHHAIVRRELARSRGREIDTAGDGFLVAFETPAHAIRSAVSISASLAEAGIRIRAGLHTGECQQYDGKLTGLTVHIAARVSQLAGPGEVLVSGTVRDLVSGSGLEFVDRGSHALKGVPGDWRLYAVAP